MESGSGSSCSGSEGKKALSKFSKLQRRPPVNIEFQDLSYSVSSADNKQILKSMNGKFCSGELTAILGASGSGKTSLLNILAGYVSSGVTGIIKTNGRSREMKIFHKLSTYIMQEDLLQPQLTVHESMMVAARLKLGNSISFKDKQIIVEEVLDLLGLENCHETRVESISGGQRKRLSIALEMVSNPPVIFLDEPTSGLDTVAIKQCIDVLETLTGQGRTVICTIHQPSVPIFQKFDQVYFIANGMCVYNGSTSNIIPFLHSVGLECPTTYSPAEYVIETAQTCEEFVPILVSAIQNGKLNKLDSQLPSRMHSASNTYEDIIQTKETTVEFPTSFWLQFYILFSRMMLQFSRNKLAIVIQVFHHAVTAAIFGLLFFGIGNDAAMILANFKLCMSVMIFFVYTYVLLPVLIFPSEVQLLKREYFNRWYGLKAYFLALTLRSLPIMLSLGVSFIGVIYLMTDQPLELNRFMWFATIGMLLAICTEGLGLAIGATFNITNGSIVAPAIVAPFLFLGIYGLGFGPAIEPYMKAFMSISYIRYGLVAMSQVVFDNRAPLECLHEIYCHYQDPKRLLRDLGMLDNSFIVNVIGLTCFSLLFRLMAFLALRYRLSYDFKHKIESYVTKFLRHE